MAAAAPVIAVEPTTSELRETTNRLTGLGNALSAAAEQRAVSRRRKSQRLSVCISRRGRWGAGQLLRLDPASPSISLDSTVVGVVGGAHTSFSDIQPGWLSIGRCSDSALAGRRCTVLPTPTIPRVCGWVGSLAGRVHGGASPIIACAFNLRHRRLLVNSSCLARMHHTAMQAGCGSALARSGGRARGGARAQRGTLERARGRARGDGGTGHHVHEQTAAATASPSAHRLLTSAPLGRCAQLVKH
eukprot:COSAG01_NODE_2151_length_8294_cov_12.317472_7_plen_245_part_00